MHMNGSGAVQNLNSKGDKVPKEDTEKREEEQPLVGSQSWQPTAVIKVYRSGKMKFEFAADTPAKAISTASRQMLREFRRARMQNHWASEKARWGKEKVDDAATGNDASKNDEIKRKVSTA